MSETATYLQIDLQNLFYAAKNRGQRIDFEKIWNYFNSRESEFLTEATVYMIHGDDFDSSKFEAKLEKMGYELCIKKSAKAHRYGKSVYTDGNHDVRITIDAIDRMSRFDKWILMSGDGDFADLAAYLRALGKIVEIWSFKECYNPALEAHADKMYFVDDSFFYKKPKIRVFGFNRGMDDEDMA